MIQAVIFNLEDNSDIIATQEDVDSPKPDPEIYFHFADSLKIPIKDCLILEDSPAGVRAGLAAGAEMITIGTEITRTKLHQDVTISSAHILDDPAKLQSTVEALMEKHKTE